MYVLILCVGPLPRIKISFFLLSICGDELISTPEIITFLANLITGNPKVPFMSNPIPYLEHLYLSISAFFTNLTAPNKEFPSVG